MPQSTQGTTPPLRAAARALVRSSASLSPRSVSLVLVSLAVLTVAPPALASGGSAGSSGGADALPASYDVGMKLVAKGEFEKARKAFDRANRKKRHVPEILNMLAYTQRKTGDFEEAIENYKRALRLRPDFPDAREYLGEAYLEAAFVQLRWLEAAGEPAKAQHDVLLRAIHDRTQSLSPPPGTRHW